MPVIGYANQVLNALDDPNPRESIYRVKEVVARELSEFDDSVEVKLTNHFNHSFSPDMVLHWPADNLSRQVFLRFTDDLDALKQDIPIHENVNNPMIFGLSSPRNQASALRELEDTISNTKMFFTEPSAVETLIESGNSQVSTARMLRNSLAQGGKGTLLEEAPARDLAKVVHEGFVGAGKLNVSETRNAIQAVERFLAPQQASRMTQVIQAVWGGANGRSDQFPGNNKIPGNLNEAALIYLMEYIESSDPIFWQGVGRNLSVSQLARLVKVGKSQNFQNLVNANIGSIRARACQVHANPLGIGEVEERDFTWSPKLQVLELVGPGFTATIAELKQDLKPVQVGKKFNKNMSAILDSNGIPVEEFIDRWSDFSVVEVHVSDDDEVMDYSAKDSNLGKKALRAKAATFKKTPFIERSTLATRSGKFSINFTESSANAVTRAVARMADLLNVAVPMLVKLDEETKLSFEAMLTSSEGNGSEELPF